jgi:hypothetical protein
LDVRPPVSMEFCFPDPFDSYSPHIVTDPLQTRTCLSPFTSTESLHSDSPLSFSSSMALEFQMDGSESEGSDIDAVSVEYDGSVSD